jgi:hypothetical protein
MNNLVLALCAAAGFVLAPVCASAFEIQGGDEATPQSPAAQYQGFEQTYVLPDFKGSSLAMPYSSKSESGNVSDYGNGISIPAPGVDQPAPAWAIRGF